MKFFKVSMLLSAYILLWGVNSFVFTASTVKPEIHQASTELSTHLIPLMMINGKRINLSDLSASQINH